MKRTLKQNRSLHQYFNELSKELNTQRIDVKVLVENLRVDSTPEMMKNIFRSIASEKYGIKSTTELTTKQVNECYDEFNRILATQGIHINFPSYQESEEYLNSFL